MLSSISTKLSMYDVLGMLIPGVMTVCLVFILPDMEITLNKAVNLSELPYWCKIIVVLISSYIIGIVNSDFTGKIWSSFRNNIEEIKAWRNAIDNGKVYRKSVNYAIVIVVSYFLITTATFFIVRYQGIVSLLISLIIAFVYFFSAFGKIIYSADKELKDYYKKYYYVEENRPVNGVKILEGQIALIKNLCLPFCLWCASIMANKDSNVIWVTVIIWLISFLILVGAAIRRQNIIYRIIFEDYKYLFKRTSTK